MSGVAIAQHAATQKKDVHAAGLMILLTDKSTLIIDLFALNQTVCFKKNCHKRFSRHVHYLTDVAALSTS